jgi:hypothetical protein
MKALKTLLKRWYLGPVVREETAAYGTLRVYKRGVVTFTSFEDGKETYVPRNELERSREWLAIATQGGGQFDVPKMHPEDAARHVAKVGGPVVYQDKAAGLIFFKARQAD